MAQINVFPRALLWGFKTHRFVKPTPFSPFPIRSLDNRIPSSLWRVAMEKDEGRGRRLSIKDSQRRPPWLHKVSSFSIFFYHLNYRFFCLANLKLRGKVKISEIRVALNAAQRELLQKSERRAKWLALEDEVICGSVFNSKGMDYYLVFCLLITNIF